MNQDFLRFLTCGSVDDGKSSLIGRLLYDAKLVCYDHLKDLYKTDGSLDCSRLLDGLLSEREQGITIDVAYRHFATPKRRFMVADAPGHEEYTPNMVTAASNSDLAVLLLDASKGFLIQTRRHAAIAKLMGIDTVLLAINKMDLVHFDSTVFQTIEHQFKELAKELQLPNVTCIPVCALTGDNVVYKSLKMPWYLGLSLLEYLETVSPKSSEKKSPFRMPVQWVNRPNSSFRGFSGTVAAGSLKKGDRITIMESGAIATVHQLFDGDVEVQEIHQGMAVTLTFDQAIDIGRGALIIAADQEKPAYSDRITADLIWMDKEPLHIGTNYLFKRGPVTRNVSIVSVTGKLNLYSFQEEPATSLGVNEQGRVDIEVTPPLPFESYDDNKSLGHGILIHKVTGAVVGALLLRAAVHPNKHITWYNFSITHSDRAKIKGQIPCCLWFTGLSGAGKSTIANLVEQKLYRMGKHTFVLDGDNIRHGLNRDLNFTAEDRVENIRRVAEVAKLMCDAGLIVLATFISPFAKDREIARSLFPKDQFYEIFVDTPLSVCINRDPKGLYQKALSGEVTHMTGISSPYEVPSHPDLRLDTTQDSSETLANHVLALIDIRS